MATPAQITEVKGKTVAQLRTILSNSGLPSTGLKQELIDRVVANPHILSSESTTGVTKTDPTAQATALGTLASGMSAASTKTLAPAPSVDDAAAIELEKRNARAKRFGMPDAVEENEKMIGRAKRFANISVSSAEDPEGVKGLVKLDQPLGLPNPRKGAEPGAKSNGAKKVIDPALAAADEEKKRKRLEKFGAIEPEGKTKKTKSGY